MEEADTQEALDQIRRQVADTRHDIKNPLSIISGNIQLMRELVRAENLDDELHEAIDDIGEATERIHSLLDQMDDLQDTISDEQEQFY